MTSPAEPDGASRPDADEVAAVPAPPPGAKARAIAEEEHHLARVHDRVEELRQRADERVQAASADRSGSTFQARFERDVTAHHHAARAARYTFGDVESLVFGRLDLGDGDTLHIGRVSVVDGEGDVVLVDWRAPAAAAFYQATAAHPLGVARRRTLTTRGRTVQDLDDEVLDVDAAETLGLTAVTGQGALLAALSRTRTGTMRDIVATIQADQDRIIRAPATGTLVVSGGPGTGKTVVALHRVASLLYRDRERFEGRGVLVIGPTAAFTEYTSRVLPSLGEDRAVQRPIAALAPAGIEVSGWDDLEVATIKGDLRMVEVCRKALAAALPPIPPETRFSFDGVTAHVPARAVEEVRARLVARVRPDRRGASYHERRTTADDALKAALWRSWRRAARSQGRHVPDEREGLGFDTALDDSAAVTMLRRCYWPALTPDGVLVALAGGEVSLAEVAADVLEPEEVARVRDAWDQAEGWTIDDVALLDELAALLGPAETRSEPTGDRHDGGIRLVSDSQRIEVEAIDVEADDYRDFAHVVVDEAQDLSPMQWRTVARRGPYASWTVVGDLAQRSRVAAPHTWEEVAALIGRREVAIRSLSVNYRTPAEIARLSREVLAAAGHDPTNAPEAVRETGVLPRLVVTPAPLEAAATAAARAVAERDGTVVVIGTDADLPELVAHVMAAVPEEHHARVRLLDPRTVKGLEFDDVVIARPEAIVAASPVGTHQLYVAVTRATRTLTLVAAPGARIPGEASCERIELDGQPPVGSGD